MAPHKGTRFQRGLTLIEACITLTVVGILAGSAVPAFEDSRQKLFLEGLAGEVRTDLQYVRSEAVARNERVKISFYAAADGAQCYVVHTGDREQCSCDGRGAGQCSGDATLLKASPAADARRVRLVANVESMPFNPNNGTATTGGTVCMTSSSGRELRNVVSMIGRVRTCTPAVPGSACEPC